MPGSVSGGRQQRVSQTVASRFSSVMSLTSTPASSSTVCDVGSGEEMRSLDCNLAALCEHVQAEGWNVGSFSDIVVQAMGSTYYLHRLILSRSTYFRNMLQGSWKEAGAPEVKLHIDDENVNGEAVAIALAYLYGHHPKLTDSNAFRVLAAASFLDLQDLCAICTDFIISELWTENFLVYQAFAESQDYGIHGERVRKACWGYLCRGGAVELKEILPKLSTQTLSTLLTSDELWVPSEWRRFELAINVLISRGALLEIGHSQVDATTESCGESVSFSYLSKDWKDDADELSEDKNKLSCLSQSGTTPQDGGVKGEGRIAIHKILMELADSVVDIYDDNSSSLKREQGGPTQQIGVVYAYRNEKPGSPNKSQMEVEINNICRPLLDSRKSIEANTGREACSSHGGQVNHFFDSQTGCYEMGKFRDKPQNCSSSQFPISSSDRSSPNQWPRDGTYCVPAWGGRVVERRQLKAYLNQSDWKCSEDWDAFLGVFEDGGILYCHMAFEELLDGRRQLEELGFPCKAVSDGLWLQTLLKQHVLTVSAETCKACGLFRTSCPCRQSYSYPHGRAPTNFYRDDQERNVGTSGGGSFHGTDGQPGITAAPVQGRVHVRAAADGLAGIGRGPTFGPPGGTWPPSRFMFSRIPFGSFGGRSSQQTLANDQPDARLDFKGMEMPVHSVDGLPSVVGLSQGSSSGVPIHSDQGGNPEESQFSARIVGDAGDATSSSGLSSQKVDSLDHTLGHEWETNESSSITLDLDTPLRTFPPFRFGVEFDNVHRLADGQSRHSSEAFYAGSLWKVSVQAFHDEDPQGRRTLGLFLHRRRADNMDSHHKVYLYTDTREKVTARYQLICPAKREVMIFGSLTQAGTLLPKAPKGWGWRTAFLFDELADLLQGGSLRVAAVVQLV